MFYNFCRIHKTLRVTPAMEAGVSKTLWSVEDIVKLVEAEEAKAIPAKHGPYKIIGGLSRSTELLRRLEAHHHAAK
jgi:hypothetical protein